MMMGSRSAAITLLAKSEAPATILDNFMLNARTRRCRNYWQDCQTLKSLEIEFHLYYQGQR